MKFKNLNIGDYFKFNTGIEYIDKFIYKKISPRKYIEAPHGKLEYNVGTINVPVEKTVNKLMITSKYKTIEDIKKTILDKYKNITVLSQDDYDNFYSHKYNGVGCAIGCLLPADLANSLDKVHTEYAQSIEKLYSMYLKYKNNNDNTKYSPFDISRYTVLQTVFEEYFNMETITIAELTVIQNCHDTSITVDGFFSKLERV